MTCLAFQVSPEGEDVRGWVPVPSGASREVASVFEKSCLITFVYCTNVKVSCTCHDVKKMKKYCPVEA